MVTDLRKAKSSPRALRTTVLMGLLLRAAALIFILTLGRQFSEPYFLSDDQAYEKLAADYLLHADCFFDWQAFKIIGAVDYLQIFWPIVIGCSSYLLGSIYAARWLNILLSAACIARIYSLTYRISNCEKTALRAARLFAYLPVTVLTCCFPIKDIFLTWAVLLFFCFFARLQAGERIHLIELPIGAVLAVCIYLSRGAVVELLGLFLAAFMLVRLARKKRYFSVAACFAVGAVGVFLLREPLLNAFETKLEDYGDYTTMDTTISRLSSWAPFRVLSLLMILFAIFYLFYKTARRTRLHTVIWTLICVLMLGVYATGGVLIELICIAFFVFVLCRLISNRKYWTAGGSFVGGIILTCLLLISAMQCGWFPPQDWRLLELLAKAIKQFGSYVCFRLPVSYFFATLQPFKLHYFVMTTSFWLTVISLLNISLYPVAISNFLYLFERKHNLLIWLTSLVMYALVISLSLGIFRHYLFLLPIQIINASLYRQNATTPKKATVFFLTVGLIAVASLYSFL